MDSHQINTPSIEAKWSMMSNITRTSAITSKIASQRINLTSQETRDPIYCMSRPSRSHVRKGT